MANEFKFTSPIVLGNFASDPSVGYAGEIYFNTTSHAYRFFDGTTWQDINTGSSAASQALDNLTSPTAVNQDLLPDTDDTRSLGSVTDRWLNLFVENINAGNQDLTVLTSNVTGANNSHKIAIDTGTTVSGASGQIDLSTGNSSSGGTTGDIDLATGTTSGTRGKISLNGAFIDANSTNIENVADPVNPQDAATKHYVDTSSGTAITSLTGDVTGTGPGAAATTVNSVGGQSAAAVASAATAVAAATSNNTPSTLVERDSSGNFSAGTITADLTGDASEDLPLDGSRAMTGGLKLAMLASAPSSPADGEQYFDTTLGYARIWQGGAWISLAPVATTPVAIVGQIIQLGAGTVPPGVLECDGSAVSRLTYANLFSVVGTNFGSGDGSTTFNLPDLRGYFLRGWDHGAGHDPDAASRTALNPGGNTGDNVGSYQADQNLSHAHSIGYYGNSPAVTGNGASSGDALRSFGATGASGGNQANPRNVTAMFGIIYDSNLALNIQIAPFYASSQVTTDSSNNTSTAFTTYSNSPAFSFSPSISGTYKIYATVPMEANTANQAFVARIFNTTGGATLLYESQGTGIAASASATIQSTYIESVYNLNAGTTYVFDIQGKVLNSGSTFIKGTFASFYMLAEFVTLSITGAAGIQALTGDVSAAGTGSVSATVNSVGGQTAANVAAATIIANGLSNSSPGTAGSNSIGDNNSYTNFTPTAATVKGALSGIDTALASVAAGVANQTLSNLTSPTAINQDLLPATDLARSLGSASKRWLTLFAQTINAGATSLVLDGTFVDANNLNIENLATPVNPNDAVTKAYVDALSYNLTWKNAVRSATTGALPSYSYNNGSSGVGATITASSNGALPAQDGVTLVVNDRLLVKDESGANQPNNGIYTVTQVGDPGTPFILTRSLDMDLSAEFFSAAVQVGPEATSQAGFGFRQTAISVVVGTTNITFINFLIGTSYIFNNGLSLTGSTVNVAPGDASLSATAGSLVVEEDPAGAIITSGSGIKVQTDASTLDINGSNQLEVKAGGITNTQVSASAAIAYSKLNLANSIQNSDIAAAAAIAYSKLAALNTNRVLFSNASGFVTDSNTSSPSMIADKILFGPSVGNVVEEQYVHAITLTNNTSSATAVDASTTFAFATYSGYQAEYYITDGSSPTVVRMGKLSLVSNSDGSAVSLTDTFNETMDLGVAFTAVTNGSNIELRYTTTNTSDRTMRIKITRFLI